MMFKPAIQNRKKLSALRSAASIFEQLEQRQLLSVSLNGSGSTVITPDPGDRIIYCSSSTGNDKNNGLSPQTAVQSITAAESLLRNHTGDELLFKAGDVWNASFGYWSLSGASAQDPMVIGSYGTGPRPEFLTGTDTGITTGRSSVPEVDYLAIMGLNFDASSRDPNLTSAPAASSNPTGINIISISNDILVENCQVQYYAVNINVEKYFGTLQNITIRRNIVENSWATTQHSEGMYALGVNNLTIDGNLFNQNGYNNQISGAVPTWYNQDCYLNASNTGCVVENNIFANAAGYGLQDRPGGIVQNNLFINDPVGMTFGLVNGASTTVGGVSGSVTGNVFIGGGNIGAVQGGQALVIGNIKPGAGVVVTHNIFTQSIANSQPAIALDYGIGQSNSQSSVGINNLTIAGNMIYDWTSGIDVMNGMTPGGAGLTALNRVAITNNEFENLSGSPVDNPSSSYLSQETFSGNTYYNTGKSITNSQLGTPVGQVLTKPIPFPDPTRSVASYDLSIGGNGSVSDFLARAAGQNESAWNAGYAAPAVISYIDAGFAVGSVTPPIVVGSGRTAKGTFQALQYTTQSGGLESNGSGALGHVNTGSWAAYADIDFGSGVSTFTANIAGEYAGGIIQLRLDSVSGPIIGTLHIKTTGGWTNYTPQSTSVSGVTGTHELFLVFTSTNGGKGLGNISTFKFA